MSASLLHLELLLEEWQENVLHHSEKAVRPYRLSPDVHILVNSELAAALSLSHIHLLENGKEASAVSVLPALLET